MSVAPGPTVGLPVVDGEPVSIGEPTPFCTTSAQGQFADTPNLCAGPLTGPAPLLLAREVEGVYYHAEAGHALSIAICTSCGCSDCYCGCCFFGVMPFLPILMGRSASCKGKKTNTFTDCVLFHTFADRHTLHVYLGCCLGDKFVRVAE